MIRVLIVEDSKTVRDLLVYILGSDPEIRIIGTVENGEQALEALERLRPDVITMDIHMPRMDGLEATRRIMETYPVPIVIVSGSEQPREVATTFRAMEAGALAVHARPRGIGHPEFEADSKELIRTLKLMSEVKVVRRWPRHRPMTTRSTEPGAVLAPSGPVEIIAIGASTGGPLVIKSILSQLPADLEVPVLIVQHMVPEFIPGFVEWLKETSSEQVGLARHGDDLLPGRIYVAPGGYQMGVGMNRKILLTEDHSEHGHVPSVSHLFLAVGRVFGRRAVGVLLTGMGKDGAEELRQLRDKGAVTLAQDRESSVVYGMPGEAVRLQAATHVLPASEIAATLIHLTRFRGHSLEPPG